MQILQPVSSSDQGRAHSISRRGATRSTKVVTETIFQSHQPMLAIQSSKPSPDAFSTGLQRQRKKDLSRILRMESAVNNIERKAKSNKYNNLCSKALLDALDEAISENRWESALQIFGLLRKQQWYEPRCQTYRRCIMMLGKCKKPKEAGFLFEIMLYDGLKPNVDVYTALVSAYGQSGQLEKAFYIVEEMKSISDCIPDVYTYSILINCCTKFRRLDLIGRILVEMSYLGIECSSVTYNIIIDGYGKAGMFEDMENTLSDMIASGCCIPDIFTLNSVVGAYGSSGQIESMEKWCHEFQIMGIEPDVMTLNIMIRSYGKAGMYEKMRSVVLFMKRRSFSPTIITYNIIIETFGKAGDIGKMDEYFLKMKHQGMKPNTITYCSLVSAYSNAGLMMKVDSILRQVENTDVALDTPFFNCIISAYGRVGEVERMAELFLAMKERKCKPDDITFATMIQAYNAKGMIEEAQNLENEMNATKDNSGAL
uniref:Uncharacterized protein MANES_07G008000 n=1 Tax=Rhizophora mucronata TaxID=61149 RepID=A0A2P2P3E8_RHIMU